MSGLTETVAEKEPFEVRCGDCEHRWIAAYTPMPMGKMAEFLKGLRCPMCGRSSEGIFATGEPA